MLDDWNNLNMEITWNGMFGRKFRGRGVLHQSSLSFVIYTLLVHLHDLLTLLHNELDALLHLPC